MGWVACENRWSALAFTMVYYLAGSWEMVPAIQMCLSRSSFIPRHTMYVDCLCIFSSGSMAGFLPKPQYRSLHVFCIVIVTLFMTALLLLVPLVGRIHLLWQAHFIPF